MSVLKLLVLYQAKRIRDRYIKAAITNRGIDQAIVEESGLSYYELVVEITNRFITLTKYGGKLTPID